MSPAWAAAIEDYLKTVTAAGQRPATLKARRIQLQQMARGLGCPPDEVTGEVLVNWFGANPEEGGPQSGRITQQPSGYGAVHAQRDALA